MNTFYIGLALLFVVSAITYILVVSGIFHTTQPHSGLFYIVGMMSGLLLMMWGTTKILPIRKI